MKSPVYEPLSAQDASFVFFEHRATHMHVVALAIFDVGPLRSATGGVDAMRLARCGESQIARRRRYRQKLAFAPLSGRPVWVDDQTSTSTTTCATPRLPGARGRGGSREPGRAGAVAATRSRSAAVGDVARRGARARSLRPADQGASLDNGGVAGASLMTTLFRAQPDATIRRRRWAPRDAPSPLRLVVDEAMDRAGTPLTLARAAVGAVRTPAP